MQQFSILLSWRLFTAQHASGVFPPIIRSSVTAVAVITGPTTNTARLSPRYEGKKMAATAVTELLMMGGKTPETCWAVNKRQDNKLKNCCIWLVIYLNWRQSYVRNFEVWNSLHSYSLGHSVEMTIEGSKTTFGKHVMKRGANVWTPVVACWWVLCKTLYNEL
jgi:hypothetical protein